MLIFYFTVYISIGSAITTYIEKDTASIPIHYHPDREIEYEVSELEYSYQIELDIISRLKTEYLHMADTCHTSKYKLPFYQIIFNSESIWNHRIDKKFKSKSLISTEPYSIQALKSDYFYFKRQNDTNLKCATLKPMVEQLLTLDIELKKINNSTYSSISSIVPVETLLKDAHNFTSNTKLINPIDFTQWFNVNFFKYSRISLTVLKNYAFLTIRIPLFTHTILSKIFPKPILHDNIPYIYSSQSEYVVEDQIGINYFSNLYENCFYANNSTFCRKPKFQNKCDSQYLTLSSKNFDRDCFVRLPLRNTITQIKNNLYFLIFKPMVINITCNNSLQSIRMFQSSKILNNECEINSPFFKFDTNSVKEYGLFNSNFTENSTEWDSFQDSELKKLINFYCFISFLLLYIVTLSLLIFLYYKQRTRDLQQEILDTPV